MSHTSLLLVVASLAWAVPARAQQPGKPSQPAPKEEKKDEKDEKKKDEKKKDENKGEKKVPDMCLKLSSVNEALARFDVPDINGDSGAAQGVPLAIAKEAVQLLGEIVVDRATAEAYRLIETKVKAALSCGESADFRATCDVLGSIRIQDIAAAPAALRTALMADATSMVMGKLSNVASAIQYGVLLREIVLPALARPGRLDTTVAASIVDHIVRYADDLKDNEVCSEDEAKAALIVAGVAVAACQGSKGTDCPLSAILKSLKCPGVDSDKWSKIADRAHSLAGKMILALRASSGDEGDVRVQVRAAIEVIFDDLCAQVDPNAGCHGTTDDARNVDILRTIVLGALDGDSNAIVAAVIRYAKAELKEKGQLPRGLRIVGALLDYASTYMPEKGAYDKGEGAAEVAKAAHEKRKKILESLTEEMTDRTDRGGDWIVSAGGSLRGVFGWRARTGHDDPKWMPLQLTLGFAYDLVADDDGPGFHLEGGVLDLGQYVSFEEDDNVREPDFADALAPSVTIALTLGRSLPFQMGFTGAYAPHFEYEDGKRGSWSLGFTTGIYVPLFDID